MKRCTRLTWPTLVTVLSPLAGTALATPPIDFDVNGGAVVPAASFTAKVTVLGAAINSGSYDRPVTLKVHLGADDDEGIELFGPFDKALSGNVNDGRNPRFAVIDGLFNPGDAITVTALSWRRRSGRDGSQNSHWRTYRQRNSQSNSLYVMVLRDGDPVPNIPGFMDQASIEEYVRDYVDLATNTMSLNEEQAIYLFELGTNNLSSPAADFQDLVVLVTLGRNAEDALLGDVGGVFD